MNVHNNYPEILSKFKEALINWKEKILELLSEKKYHHKVKVYLITQKYLEQYEKNIINTPKLDRDKLTKVNSIFNESYNLCSQIKSKKINDLPKIFPLDETNYNFFKSLVMNKDNNHFHENKYFVGEFEESFIKILLNGTNDNNELLYLFYFEYSGNLRQGFLKIKDKSSFYDIMDEFGENGPIFFLKDKTGKHLDDEEVFECEDRFELFILRKSEINIEKTKKELEEIKQIKLTHSTKLPDKNLIQKTFINLIYAKKPVKLTNIFNSYITKKLKKTIVGHENIYFEEEDIKTNINKNNNNNEKYLTNSIVENNDNEIYLSKSMFGNNIIKRHSSIMSIDDSPGGLIGLTNIGATCYMNATLQCFSNIEYLRTEFLNPEIYIKLESNKEKKMRLSFALAEVLKNLWLKFDDKKSYPPENFKKLISEMNPLFRGIQANDPKDLILFMLETMHSELRTVNINITVNNNFVPNEHNLMEVYQDFANYYLSKNKSIIFDIFYGCTNIVTSCCLCGSEIHNVQVNNIIFFPLEEVRKYKKKDTNTPVTLIDCFEYNQRYDIYQSYFCNVCNNNKSTAASFTRYLYSPKVLIINFNRGKGIQFNVKINFEEFIDIRNFVYCKDSPYKYELIGVICHFGESSMSGHFIAFCKHFSLKGDKWYKFNDAFVNECTFDEVKNSGMPYVLFYSYLDVDES